MMSPGKDSDLGVVGKGSSGDDGLGGKGLDTGGKFNGKDIFLNRVFIICIASMLTTKFFMIFFLKLLLYPISLIIYSMIRLSPAATSQWLILTVKVGPGTTEASMATFMSWPSVSSMEVPKSMVEELLLLSDKVKSNVTS